MRRTRTPALAGLAAAALVLTGCAGDDGTVNGMEEAARSACADFTGGLAGVQTKRDRVELAERVNESASRSDIDAVVEGAAVLVENADRDVRQWREAIDGFAQACRDSGWNEAD